MLSPGRKTPREKKMHSKAPVHVMQGTIAANKNAHNQNRTDDLIIFLVLY